MQSYKGAEMPAEEEEKMRSTLMAKYEHEGSSYYSTSRIWDDGIIDPVDTRKILGMGISMALNKQINDPKFGIFRM